MKFLRIPHIRSRFAVIALVLAVATQSATAAPGDLDTSFDPGLILWQGFPFPAFKYAIVLQPDGKVIIGGRFDTVAGVERIFVARLNTNGSLDTSFNTPLQRIQTPNGPDGEVYDLLLQPDGKIIVSGYFHVGGVHKTVVRLDPNGSLDTTFNVTTNNGSSDSNYIYRMLLQPDGKIIIASNGLESVNGVTTNRIARLTATGSLDNPLGVPTNITFAIFALALQPDGKIVIGGGGGGGGLVVRINSDGTDDTGFTSPDIGPVSVDSLAIEQDGQILVGARGRLTVNGNLTDGLIRLNSNGTFDLSFNPPDIRTAWTLYVQEDGKIAVGGSFTVNFGLYLASFGRINPDGSLDFIPDGGGPDNDLLDIVRQPDGRYIVVGTFEYYYQGKTVTERTGVARIFDAGGPTPLTGRIAFTSGRDGNQEIYVMNADGTNQTRLTNNPALDHSPTVSVDGSRIAFVSERDGNPEIYVMNSDGTGQTRLTNNTTFDGSPSLSSDGNQIVFLAVRDDIEGIFTMNSNGTNQVRVTSTKLVFTYSDPSFSPDGSKIAFSGFGKTGYVTDEIHTINVNGTNLIRLTNNSFSDFGTSWSPDGTKIAFASNRDGVTGQIYIMNSDGSNQTRVSNNTHFEHEPSFNLDGSRIAFTSQRDGNAEIYVMNLDGTGQLRLTNSPQGDFLPSWGGSATPTPTPTPPTKLKLEGGNLLVGSPGAGLILRSPNGTACIKLAIDNAGGLAPTLVTCP